jgi:hypothetical protein
MNYLISIFPFFLLLPLFLFVLLFIFQRKKERKHLARAMHLSLFLVTVPQRIVEQEKFSLKEYLKTCEQFFSSLSGVKGKNVYFTFEIAVPRIGEEIHFFVACPKEFSQLIEKQILSFWPKAQVQTTSDYNIFNPEGFSVGAEALLEKSPILPLKFSDEFTTDPLSSLTTVFTKLAKEGEGAAIQVLIRPTKTKVRKIGKKTIELIEKNKKVEEAIMEATGMVGPLGIIREFFSPLTKPSEKEKKGEILKREKDPLILQISQAIAKKTSLPLFDVNIRILASAGDEFRANQLLDQFQAAFKQFDSPILNQIKFRKLSKKSLEKLFYLFSFRLFNFKNFLTLSSDELAAIFHFPPPVLLTPKIKWLKAKQAPAPPNLPEEGTIIGKNVFRGEERLVRILDEDRRRHFYIIGQTGTGKSSLLQEMIRQDIEAGRGVCLIDPHGDLAERVLTLIPPERIKETIYFDPSDVERPIGLNMLEHDPTFPESKTFITNELLEIFEKLYNLKALGFGGPIYEQYMRNAILLVMEDPESGNTLIEIPRVLSDSEFRRYKLSRCKNIVVKNFWELEAEKARGELALANLVPYITSKMNIFIANDLVRPIIAQQKSSLDFREIIDQGRIFIVNLAKGKLGDINSYLLGMIIVGRLLIAAFSRANIPEEKRRDFYLYIDEFQNVTTKTIANALAEARKFRLSLILAHQFIGQLDEETKKAIFGNIGSILAFRVGPDDAKYLITQYGPEFDENDLVNFDNFNGALRLLIRGELSKPFSLVTLPPKKGNPEIAELVKKFSREKYGREREKVEMDLYQRLQKSYGWKI